MSERPARKATRYPVKAPVVFRWKDTEGHDREGTGNSRNVSETGAFVLSAISPPPGTDIELVISFLALENAMTTEPVKLHGRVLRVEPIASSKGIAGFAVLAERVIFP
jgi:hypothetical protein